MQPEQEDKEVLNIDGETPAAPALAGKKVLWVEDDSFLKDIVAQKLTEQHWELLYASEGESALKIARDSQPAAIVLDILLAGMDGLEVLAKLKADEATKNIPVVMLTNFDDDAKVAEAKRLGAQEYFLKATVDLDAVIARIQKLIA